MARFEGVGPRLAGRRRKMALDTMKPNRKRRALVPKGPATDPQAVGHWARAKCKGGTGNATAAVGLSLPERRESNRASLPLRGSAIERRPRAGKVPKESVLLEPIGGRRDEESTLCFLSVSLFVSQFTSDFFSIFCSRQKSNLSSVFLEKSVPRPRQRVAPPRETRGATHCV